MYDIKGRLRWYHPNLSEEGEGFLRWQHRRGMDSMRAGSIATIVLPILIYMFWAQQGVHTLLTQVIPFVLIGLIGFTSTFLPFVVKHINGFNIFSIIVLGQLMAWGLNTVISFPKIEIIFAPVTLLLIVIATTPIKPVWLLVFTLFTDTSMWIRNGITNFDSFGEMPADHYFEYFKLFLLGFLAMTLRAVILNTQVKMHRSTESAETALEQLKSAHGRLVQAEKISSQAQLAAAVSHEVNNPLGVVKSNTDSIRTISKKLVDMVRNNSNKDGEKIDKLALMLRELTDSNQESVERISDLTAKLQRFTNLDRGELQEINIISAINDTVDLMGAQLPEKKRIKVSGERNATVKGNPAEFGELFTQILQNSGRAVKDGGDIYVSVTFANAMVNIRFDDTGGGIPPENLAKLFNPEFKSEDGRMKAGWGLFISRQIVSGYGGTINVSSEIGKGTSIEISLPSTHH